MFTKGKSPDNPPTPQQPTPPPAGVDKRPPMAGSRSGPSLISADVKITGSIVSQGELQIDGHIEGDVRASALTIGNTGAVKGEIAAETVIVRGSVKGSVRGKKVQLCTGAKVEGDITHASLAIEPNAIFEGQVRHAQDPLAGAAAGASGASPRPAES